MFNPLEWQKANANGNDVEYISIVEKFECWWGYELPAKNIVFTEFEPASGYMILADEET